MIMMAKIMKVNVSGSFHRFLAYNAEWCGNQVCHQICFFFLLNVRIALLVSNPAFDHN